MGWFTDGMTKRRSRKRKTIWSLVGSALYVSIPLFKHLRYRRRVL